MPYKVCPFLATNFGSPNLHLCSILRSQDGSCCKVKIIAVILGEPTQTDNSWQKQMWSTEDCARLCWCHPCASSLSLTDKGHFFCFCSPPELLVTGESIVLIKLASISPLSFCINHYFLSRKQTIQLKHG